MHYELTIHNKKKPAVRKYVRSLRFTILIINITFVYFKNMNFMLISLLLIFDRCFFGDTETGAAGLIIFFFL